MTGRSSRRANGPSTPASVRAPGKVLCETPTPGKQPVRIDAWKYRAVRDAVLRVLPREGSRGCVVQGLAFSELPAMVSQALSPEDRTRLGSASWYTTTVKLDLEVKGEVRRLPGSPQRLVRTAA